MLIVRLIIIHWRLQVNSIVSTSSIAKLLIFLLNFIFQKKWFKMVWWRRFMRQIWHRSCTHQWHPQHHRTLCPWCHQWPQHEQPKGKNQRLSHFNWAIENVAPAAMEHTQHHFFVNGTCYFYVRCFVCDVIVHWLWCDFSSIFVLQYLWAHFISISAMMQPWCTTTFDISFYHKCFYCLRHSVRWPFCVSAQFYSMSLNDWKFNALIDF